MSGLDIMKASQMYKKTLIKIKIDKKNNFENREG